MATSWTLQRTVDPSVLPVSLSEAKSHLRLAESDTTHDENLTLLLNAATTRVEQDTDRQLVNATYRQDQYDWNDECDFESPILLRKKGVSSVTSVEYVDTDGALQTLSTDDWVFDAGRGLVYPDPEVTLPSVQARNPQAVRITFVAGFGSTAASVPRIFKQAILLCIGKWFYDPAQEGSALHSQEIAYDRIIHLVQRAAY